MSSTLEKNLIEPSQESIFQNLRFKELREEIYTEITNNLQANNSNLDIENLKNNLNKIHLLETKNIYDLLENKYQKALILKSYLQSIFNKKEISRTLNSDQEMILYEVLLLDILYYGPLSPFILSHFKLSENYSLFKNINSIFFKYSFSNRIIEIQVNNYMSLFLETLSGKYSIDYKFISDLHLEKTIINLINEANHLKKQNYTINQSNPILDFELAFEQLRGSVIIPPITPSPCLTIRFHPNESYSISTLEEAKMFDNKISKFLYAVQKSGLSVAIAGTMSTGKTTLLSALLKEWDLNARKALIEDTREIEAKIENLIQLQINSKDKSSNIQALIKACKRHSVKYVALSEARDGDAWEIVQLAQNIYGCLMTYHYTVRDSIKKANNALNNLAYLCSLNKESPNIEEIKNQIACNVQILILLKQDSLTGKRVIDSIYFINKAITGKVTEFNCTEIFQYCSEKRNFEFINRVPDLEDYFKEKGVDFKF